MIQRVNTEYFLVLITNIASASLVNDWQSSFCSLPLAAIVRLFPYVKRGAIECLLLTIYSTLGLYKYQVDYIKETLGIVRSGDCEVWGLFMVDVYYVVDIKQQLLQYLLNAKSNVVPRINISFPHPVKYHG